MKPHIDIVILDEDRYFAQGLETLLHTYFVDKGWSITFLPAQLRHIADLIIVSDKVIRPLQYCHLQKPGKQHRIISIQKTPQLRRQLSACTSEHWIIRRSDSTEVVLRMIEQMFGGLVPVSPHQCSHCSRALTPREWEVLNTIRLGMLPCQIAGRLNLSVKTVSTHKRAAMRKLGFQRNTELYQWLLQGGLDIKI